MARDEDEEELTVDAPKEVDMFTSVRCLGYLSSFTLLVAVCVGMYVRWEVTEEAMIMVIFILGLVVLGIASILHYYFAMEKASLSLFHLWCGFLLGLLCFFNSTALDSNVKELVTNYLLLASVTMKTIWALTERICSSIRYKPTLLTSSEFLELLGFGIASTAMLLHKSVAIIGMVVALGALIVDLRMKSLLALPNLVSFALITSLVFFKALGITANPYALGCYLGRQLCEPVLDVYFSGLGPSDRWRPVLSLGRIWRRLSLLPLSVTELAFFVLAALKPTVLYVAVFLNVTLILFFAFLQHSNCLFLSALLVVLPLESLTHGLFHELGSCLGGTCVGYALVIPTAYCSADGQPTLLPPEQVQQLNMRSTGMLNNVQRLFSHHMIQTFGCDYSTSGVTLEAVLTKLRSFLDLRTEDGPRHDTYLIFYSGHTHKGTGSWALAGVESFHLGQLLELWKEKNAGHCSRLIIVLDTENSLPWVKEVRRMEGVYVAAQGAELSVTRVDPEGGDIPLLGDFTSEWVEFNCNPESDTQWSDKGRSVMAAYGVSKRWSDYTLHLPTGSDVAKHWKTHFPKVTYPMVHLSNWCCGLNLFWLCSVCLRCFRRCKLAWFPPAVLDTGQGIKLVHS
ncbi:transmembrane protein 168-A-like [Notothenia coriiceps]|uniref:Transmembrane protein 168-A-like n=1 Tax=Notothenia coriiceps TaxID=8208 RepID=A0A6I9PDT5_9TELE|nr:PREDICTED: transmembrane protein 168-A-like [Notothenia coriiceps]